MCVVCLTACCVEMVSMCIVCLTAGGMELGIDVYRGTGSSVSRRVHALHKITHSNKREP